MLSEVLEKDLVKLEHMERTSEGVQRDGTTSIQACKLCDSPRKLYHSVRVLEGRNEHCTGLGDDEIVGQNFQTDEREILGFRMQNVIMFKMRLVEGMLWKPKE